MRAWPSTTRCSTPPDVRTICVGMGMSAAAMILAGGAAGKRMALPHAKVMIHQGSAGFRGTPADIEIHAQEVLAMTRQMAEIIARHCVRPIQQVMADIDRDRFMTPERGPRLRPHRRDRRAARRGGGLRPVLLVDRADGVHVDPGSRPPSPGARTAEESGLLP